MAVDEAATMPRNMLDHGQHAAAEQPFRGGAAELGDALGIAAIGTVADDGVGTRNPQIETGQAIDGNAERGEIGGDETRRDAGPFGCAGAERGDALARGIAAPMRRLQPGDAPALLIDEDRRVAPNAAAQGA